MASKITSATEQRSPRTRGLGNKSTVDIVRAIHREDATVNEVIAKALPAIARAVDTIVESFQHGGRLFYVGAGTSGRLAALDAAELPPTFGTSPSMVQAVIAGGRRALTHAAESAEDSRAQGASDLAAHKITGRDAIVGITASGSTPYVLGALEFGAKHKAKTIGITSNPGAPITRAVKISIVTPTGPEVITGSTRMKAGTAQKMVLNMLSTAAMVRIGRVYDNWMIGGSLTNQKLQARGLRILAEATGATVEEATRALRQSGHSTEIALVMLMRGLGPVEAKHLLGRSDGNVRDALDRKKSDTKGSSKAHG